MNPRPGSEHYCISCCDQIGIALEVARISLFGHFTATNFEFNLAIDDALASCVALRNHREILIAPGLSHLFLSDEVCLLN